MPSGDIERSGFNKRTDLGILLDTKLTFNNHIAYISAKASKMLGFTFRVSKHFKNVNCLKKLFCALTRSVLEYGSIVWAPYYMNNISRIESIQRKFVRFALRHLPWRDPLHLPSYENRCKLIGLDTLSVRRDVAKAIFACDLILSRIDCPDLLEMINLNAPMRNLRSNNLVYVPFARTNYSYNNSFTSICRIFNQCNNVFDFHLSRTDQKKLFLHEFRNVTIN